LYLHFVAQQQPQPLLSPQPQLLPQPQPLPPHPPQLNRMMSRMMIQQQLLFSISCGFSHL
jgi:hypothetical protein